MVRDVLARMRWVVVVWLLALSLAACGGRGDESSENSTSGSPGSNSGTAANGGTTPEGTTDAFITACLQEDIVTAKTFMTQELQALVGNPCRDFSDARFHTDHTIIENRTAGATTYVTWQWVEQDRFIPRYEFALAEGENGWLIVDAKPVGVQATPIPTPTIELNPTSDIPVDEALTEAFGGLPVPIGAGEGGTQPGWTFNYNVSEQQYTADDLLTFYLYQMEQRGWQLEADSVSRVVDEGRTTAAGGRWFNDQQTVTVNITAITNRDNEDVVTTRFMVRNK